jgi:hypothetical protein
MKTFHEILISVGDLKFGKKMFEMDENIKFNRYHLIILGTEY